MAQVGGVAQIRIRVGTSGEADVRGRKDAGKGIVMCSGAQAALCLRRWYVFVLSFECRSAT